ncbi:sensor domain-containing diguanylate cyclase [Maledivibacter halophilus]|uniref:PAS domain S-box-containing protein/diguanylate cyclase (GGDEF) domain-containing protein n=1 Tax=Maledivibacter halophilus TaxID=36842 RepID=A0A1T5M931_9FIRM|nr:sensor domain-containing diguanylate cyclase [Maledivibacter halophilus]SKC84747.1 PAS domain S-box-containing protein/diguanylate cyclase (GGDEF) domain-containing protein [Maledivibacter halophilus]
MKELKESLSVVSMKDCLKMNSGKNIDQDTIQKDSANFLQKIINTIPNPIFVKDFNGIYQYCNIALAKYLGLKHEDVIGSSVYDVYPKELADIYCKADSELMKKGGTQTYEAKLIHKDGSLHDVIFNKGVIKDLKDEITGLVGVIVDITERKVNEKRIRRLLKMKEVALEVNQAIIGIKNINELFDIILKKVTDVIEDSQLACVLLLDDNKKLKIASSKGYDDEASKSYALNLTDTFLWREANGKFEKAIIINDIQRKYKNEFPDILENNKFFDVQSSISAPIIVDKKLYGFINVDSSYNNAYDELDLEMMEYLRNQVSIVISNHKLYEKIIYLSKYDKLTKVYNRSYFEELFNEYIENAMKNNERFYLVLFDLNGLKLVNDTYGHLAGDKLIKSFAINISNLIEDNNFLARFGGDEFIAVFSYIKLQELIDKFEIIIKYFKNNPINFEGNFITCQFSYGIAKFPYDSKYYDQLVSIADERMYEFKKKIKKPKEIYKYNI